MTTATAEKRKAAVVQEKAGPGPLDLVREARRKVEALGSAFRDASAAVRRRAEDLRKLEAADKWSEAEVARADLPRLQREAGTAQERLRTAEGEVAAIEAEARRFVVARHRPAAEKLLHAAQAFLDAARDETRAWELAKTSGVEIRGHELPQPVPPELLHLLSVWYEAAAKQARILAGSR